MIDADALAALAYELDPSLLMADLGMNPDPWQRRVLRSRARRMLMLCSRQSGKSTTTAVLTLNTVLHEPGALVVVLSPTLRQSGELFGQKIVPFYERLGKPVPPLKQNETSLILENGARVVSLPGSPDTIRGFSAVHTVIVDEAALVASDDLFVAVSPMLAVSQGRLILLSSPKGQRGYFHEQWERGGDLWERVRVTAADCPRITPEFLDAERRAMGDLMYKQEYFCEFHAGAGQYFDTAAVNAAFETDEPPLFAEAPPTDG